MINKEWLEEIKKEDDNLYLERSQRTRTDYRQAKALEIIAEELIQMNKKIDLAEKLKREINKG
jgi:hypothetical protein